MRAYSSNANAIHFVEKKDSEKQKHNNSKQERKTLCGCHCGCTAMRKQWLLLEECIWCFIYILVLYAIVELACGRQQQSFRPLVQ